MSTKNLGPVKGIFRQALSPSRTDVLWYDTVNHLLKYFDEISLSWFPLLHFQFIGLLTSNTPTAAEITTVIGLTASEAGAGFQCTIRNLNDNKLYQIESDGSSWFYNNQGIRYDDWFLPSKDLLIQIYNNIKDYGIGGFTDNNYWSSTEFNATVVYLVDFSNGSLVGHEKAGTNSVRACRQFISSDIYNLRDLGPAGGFISYIVDNGDGTFIYYEVAPADEVLSIWSNIDSVAIGTTSSSISEGQNNTNKIIGQVGHITSAAKLCDDLVI